MNYTLISYVYLLFFDMLVFLILSYHCNLVNLKGDMIH